MKNEELTMDNCVFTKGKAFAIRVVNLYKYLRDNRYERVMSTQLLRCGTSIGANIAEAQYAVSKADFTNKMFIALKESSETNYWLELLYKTDYITLAQYNSLICDAQEIHALLSAICKTCKCDSKKA